jgi:nucleoside-diphosphate-sugar epimerase
MKQKQWLNLLASALGAPPVTRHVPYRVAYSAAFLMECFGHLFKTQRPPMITRYAVWLMGRRSFFSAEKARRELGWKSTVPYEEGVQRTVRWLEQQEGDRASHPAHATATAA